MKESRRRTRDALSIAIIGGGTGGIQMGVRLIKAGIDDFTIFEQSDGPGGTWHDSHYPGAACDTPQPFYSFAFKGYTFSSTHVLQTEFLQYLEETVDQYGLRDHFRFGSAVERVEWDDTDHFYRVSTADGYEGEFRIVVSAVGILNNPRYPNWPGLEDFEGPSWHSARWEHQHDLTGKRVAVVGTGSSGAQIVPQLASKVSQLYVFQREPGWVQPKGEHIYTAEERAKLAKPFARWMLRTKQFIQYERAQAGGRGATKAGSPKNKAGQETCVQYIKATFADRPDLEKLVTPTYPYLGKRPVKESAFYPALLRDNVELVPHAVTRVTKDGIVDVEDVERKVDAIVMCTGFRATEFLGTFEVTGWKGRTIHDIWGQEPFAFAGLTVPGIPNFYMIYGPNTNGGQIIYQQARQSAYILQDVKRLMRTGRSYIEVKDTWTTTFNKLQQHHLKGTASQISNNYSKTATGRNVVSWGDGLVLYYLVTKLLRLPSSVCR